MVSLTTIQFTSKAPTARITLNRPQVLNAINGEVLREIREAVALAGNDKKIRVLVIDSTSPNFSSGIDVAYVKDARPFEVREIGRELHRTFHTLRVCKLPIIAGIDGFCLGAGLELALSCDLMIGTTKSRYGLPNIDRGIPAIVEAALLPLAVGIQHARYLCLTGEFWSAEEALARGLITTIVEPENLPAVTMEKAKKLAEKSPYALDTQKEIMYKWMTTDLESAIEFSINTVVLNWQTREQKEAMSTFLEKAKKEK